MKKRQKREVKEERAVRREQREDKRQKIVGCLEKRKVEELRQMI
jgi:hypothetical protein